MAPFGCPAVYPWVGPPIATATGCGSPPGAGLGSMTRLGASLRSTMAAGYTPAVTGDGPRDRIVPGVPTMRRRWWRGLAAPDWGFGFGFGGVGWGVGINFGWFPLGWGEPFYPWYHGWYGHGLSSAVHPQRKHHEHSHHEHHQRYEQLLQPQHHQYRLREQDGEGCGHRSAGKRHRQRAGDEPRWNGGAKFGADACARDAQRQPLAYTQLRAGWTTAESQCRAEFSGGDES